MIRRWYLFGLLFLVLGCAGHKVSLILSAEDQFNLAKREYDKKNYSDAVLEFQKLIFNYPGVAFIDSAQFLFGMCYFKEKDYPASVGEFKKLLTSFSTSSLADDASFMIAFAHYKDSPKVELDQKNTLQAIGELESFLEEYPASEHFPEAQQLLFEARSKIAQKFYKSGCIYYKLKHYEATLLYLQEVLDQYPDTKFSPSSSFFIAETYWQQKKYDLAELEYRKFLEKYPGDKLASKIKDRLKKLDKEKIQARK
jgi:outer membrane protein assembly factor BamD